MHRTKTSRLSWTYETSGSNEREPPFSDFGSSLSLTDSDYENYGVTTPLEMFDKAVKRIREKLVAVGEAG